jgi:hypothetical protein
MATDFAPSVDTIIIDIATYGSLSTGADQQDKLEALADTLVGMGEGWTRVASSDFNGVNQGWFVVLQHGAGPIYTQICLAYCNALSDFDGNNLGGQYKPSNGLYIAYKTSTSGANFDYSTDDPNGSTFISDANSFKFVLCHDQGTAFHNNDWKFTWLADASQVVLAASDSLMVPNGLSIMSETAIDEYYNSGDTRPELQLNWSTTDMTPGVDTTHGHQFYRYNDGTMISSHGSICNGLACHAEIMTSQCNPVEPWFVQKLAVWNDAVGSCNNTGSGDNSIKGNINMDLLSFINHHNLVDWQQIDSGNNLHIHDGIMVGYDPTNGPVPTS